MFKEIERPLELREKRLLKRELDWMAPSRKVGVLSSFIAKALMGYGGMAFLCFLGYLAADPPPLWFFALNFFGAGTVITVWLWWDDIKDRRHAGNRIQRILTTMDEGLVKETFVRAERVIEVQQWDDEGPSYFFEVGPKKLFHFYLGQEYPSSRMFPNTDFSVIEVFHPNGEPMATIVKKRGKKLEPERVVSRKSEIRQLVYGLYDETILECDFDEFEDYVLKGKKE